MNSFNKDDWDEDAKEMLDHIDDILSRMYVDYEELRWEPDVDPIEDREEYNEYWSNVKTLYNHIRKLYSCSDYYGIGIE